MKFKVLAEVKVAKEFEVEASSHEEAIKLASAQKIQLTGRAKITWAGLAESVDTTGYYECQNIGPCERCEGPITDREIPGQPWNYDSDPDDPHGPFVCYACLVKAGKVVDGKLVREAKNG